MDRLDQLIADKQAELQGLQEQIASLGEKHERALIELETLKAAAAARPATPAVSSASAAPKAVAKAAPKAKERTNGKRKGGRSAGDISHEWRKVLATAQALHRRLSYTDLHEIAAQLGIKTKMPNVRERVRTMAENSLLAGNAEIGFLVTAEAARRFGFDKAQAA